MAKSIVNDEIAACPRTSALMALEIATEINDRRDWLCALAHSIRDELLPNDGKEPTEPRALALMKLLVSQLEDMRSEYQLHGYLSALQPKVRQENSEN